MTAGRPRRRTRPRGRRRWVPLVAVAAGLALLAGAEGVARHGIDGRIAAAARRHLTGPVSVGIGAPPAVWDLATGHIDTVTIRAPHMSECRLTDLDTTPVLHDVRAAGHGAGGSTDATVVVTGSTIAHRIEKGSKLDAVVIPDPAKGTVVLSLGPAGVLRVNEKPSLQGATITAGKGLAVRLHGGPSSLRQRDGATGMCSVEKA